MTEVALLSAGTALAETLEAENAALDALDIGRATRLLPHKRTALARFAAAQDACRGMLSATASDGARRLATRLTQATAENKRLLERAIDVQGQVIARLLRAVPAAMPVHRYGAAGRRHGRTAPVTLRARA